MEVKPLAELVAVTKGKKPSATSAGPEEGFINYLQIDNLRPNAKAKYCSAKNSIQAAPSDVILAWDGANAGISASGLEGAIGSTLARLRPNNLDQLDGGYLSEFLRFKESELRRNTNGATVPHIDPRYLGLLEVPLPPLRQQQKVAQTLSAIRLASQLALECSTQVTELRHAMLDELCAKQTWPSRPLRDLTTKIGSGSTPKGGKESYSTEGTALVRSMNIHDGLFVWRELARLNELQAEKLKNVSVSEGDVFLNITGASVARSCAAPSDLGDARVNQHVMILRPNPELLNASFLESVLISPTTKQRLLQIAGGGSTREAITKGQLELFEIPCPPIEKQIEFATRLDSSKRVAESSRLRISKLLELFQSTQELFFTGTADE
jgi:type I restriction enzyme S subunit